MKKKFKRILLGISIVLVLIILIIAGFMIKTIIELNKMVPMESMVIVDNIISVNDSIVNFYLIQDGSKFIAVDCGNHPEVISDELKKLNINPDNILAIFLTHTDFDHAAGLRLFDNAKVYLSKQEEQMINGEESRFFFSKNIIDTEDYLLLEDQQTLNIGNIKIKGILTPGHTPGSMCYLINDKYLFTGDALSLKDGKIDRFNEFFNMDTDNAIESMDKITGLPGAEYIFTAHYGYSDNYKNAVNDWNK